MRGSEDAGRVKRSFCGMDICGIYIFQEFRGASCSGGFFRVLAWINEAVIVEPNGKCLNGYRYRFFVGN